MPSKKKKYNARFPAGRIKKIMQSDEEVGKVAQAVPVIISRTLELFVESLLTKTLKITNSRNAKTLSPSHMKQCIMAENRFDFLRELVKNIPDISISEETGQDGNIILPGTPIIESPPQQEPYDLSKPSTSCEINFPITFSNINSNGNSVIRNGNTIGNNNNSIGNKINITTSNNTIVDTNIPSLPTHTTTTRKTATLGHLSTTTTQSSTILPNNSREELMRQWDSVSQIRQQMLSTMQATTTTTTVPIQHTITSSSTMNFYNTNNNNNNNSNTNKRKTSNSTLIADCNPPKLKRMDSLPITTDKFTNININIDKKNRKLQHQPKSLPTTTDLLSLQKQDNKLLPAVPASIVDMDICNKPIIKIDYSNINLHDSNDYPISTSLNNNNNNDNPKKNTKTITNSNISNLITSTADDLTKKNSPITTFNPVINIDLSKIGTQPPTIHFNLSNITTTSNVSSTKIDTKINSSAIRSSSLDLDEDYDNI